MGVLETHPLRDVSAPPAGSPRCTFVELPDVLRLVEGTSLPFRPIFALAYGAGLEISAILALCRRRRRFGSAPGPCAGHQGWAPRPPGKGG
jgi:hypothetical protein